MAVREDTKSPRRTSTGKTPRTPRPLKTPRPPKAARNNDRFLQDMVGVALFAAGVISLVSLVALQNAGALGAGLANSLKILFGLGAYVVPFLMVGGGVVLIYGRSPSSRAEIFGGCVVLWLICLAWLDYAHAVRGGLPFDGAHVSTVGGLTGAAINYGVHSLLGVGSPVLYFALAVMTVVWMTDRRLLYMMQACGNGIAKVADALRYNMPQLPARTGGKPDRADQAATVKAIREPESRRKKAIEAPEPDTAPTVVAQPKPFVQLPPVKPQVVVQKSLNLDRLAETNDHVNPDYQLPPLDLLEPPNVAAADSAAVNAERQQILMRTLNDFKIGADVKQVAMGPTVTRYEVALDPGILVKKIVALADNLAMSLAAIDVRVEAPIPGKSAIGIEVPNERRQIVTLRACLDTAEFHDAPSKLTFALGKDVAGVDRFADLAKMPHVLVGGATNSGKSCCLNALISSIVYRATPREVQFIMIDPKRVELSLYEGIPHLAAPVVKDTKQAAGILRSVLVEMEKRYGLFADKGTRNIDGYNAQVDEKKKLPYLVIVIDELADLMATQGPDVEMCIARLTALARATGIHMVIATQRPSVDVITGTIKANIPSRIAFSVATNVDSRTILDTPGADRLIGRGDMLYLSIDASKPVRIQGCYVTEAETNKLVKYLKDQEEPKYTMTPTAASDGFSDETDDGDTDELFEPAVRWLASQYEKGASTSSLQRRFKVGYTRAARLIECMEARGIVGPQEGQKPRDVMLHPLNVDAYFNGKGQGVVAENMAFPDDDEAEPGEPVAHDDDDAPF
ncbi:MAG: DNA translocase FtsK 4TM domain-containing protein [Capsulimonadaceae bacterium]|nr:DNA translocase FtsK 4TM domain-containing protein [Capsulimonadaceae bacterium]